MKKPPFTNDTEEQEPSMNGTQWMLLIVTVLTAGLSLYLLGSSYGWFSGSG